MSGSYPDVPASWLLTFESWRAIFFQALESRKFFISYITAESQLESVQCTVAWSLLYGVYSGVQPPTDFDAWNAWMKGNLVFLCFFLSTYITQNQYLLAPNERAIIFDNFWSASPLSIMGSVKGSFQKRVELSTTRGPKRGQGIVRNSPRCLGKWQPESEKQSLTALVLTVTLCLSDNFATSWLQSGWLFVRNIPLTYLWWSWCHRSGFPWLLPVWM